MGCISLGIITMNKHQAVFLHKHRNVLSVLFTLCFWKSHNRFSYLVTDWCWVHHSKNKPRDVFLFERGIGFKNNRYQTYHTSSYFSHKTTCCGFIFSVLFYLLWEFRMSSTLFKLHLCWMQRLFILFFISFTPSEKWNHLVSLFYWKSRCL